MSGPCWAATCADLDLVTSKSAGYRESRPTLMSVFAVCCAGVGQSNQAQTKSDVAQQVQVQVVGELDNLSLTDVPRDRLKRSAGSFSQK